MPSQILIKCSRVCVCWRMERRSELVRHKREGKGGHEREEEKKTFLVFDHGKMENAEIKKL